MPALAQRLPTPEVQPADLDGDLPTIFEFARWIIDQITDWIARFYEKLLEAYLAGQLGERGARGNQFIDHGCPDCTSRSARRKGWRERTVAVPKLGDLSFERPYVECTRCGRSYAPFDRDIGIEARGKYMGEALIRPMEAVCEHSYRRGAEAYPESPSAMTLWRWVRDHQPDLPRGPQGEEEVCIIDATGIPGRAADQQHALGIAHQVRPDGLRYNRPVFERRPIGATCGGEASLTEPLRETDSPWVIHDGALNLDGIVEHPVRCRWHIGYGVGQGLLYRDQVTGAPNKEITDEIIALTRDLPNRPEAAAQALRGWVNRYRQKAPRSAHYVEEAIDGLTEPIGADKDLPAETTSPAEREIRELNRRFENGGQWSKDGAERLLTHVQMYRHEPTAYTDWINTTTDTGFSNVALVS
mgnify:CR=1 FL=1